MDLAEAKYPLSPWKVVKKSISSLIFWVILLGAIYLVFFYYGLVIANPQLMPLFAETGKFLLILIVAIFILSILYQWWYYKTYFYDLTDNFVIIKKGPIAPQEVSIPYSRIQDVYVDQDLFDRVFGLYDVHVSSATILSGFMAHIDGVGKTSADGLKIELLAMIKQKTSKK